MRRVSGSKRWFRFWGLGIAAAVISATGAASGSCVFDTRTNFCEQFSLHCKEGQECAANQAICIDIGGCGNGKIDNGEICDDGNIVDGETINGIFVLDKCNHDCTSTQECGNEILDIGEACDHGEHNGAPGDTCDAHCNLVNEVCGNGIVENDRGEQCDSGLGSADSQDCNGNSELAQLTGRACRVAMCGDGYVNTVANEECDNGGHIVDETCNGPLCTLPRCGDGFYNPFNSHVQEQCDTGIDTQACNGNSDGDNSNQCHIPVCGDGYTNKNFIPSGAHSPEECDTRGDSLMCNGNNDKTGDKINNPDSKCHLARCGDDYVNTMFIPGDAGVEVCDNGSNDTSGCNGNESGPNDANNLNVQCQIPKCGDGYINTKFAPGDAGVESCDNGSDDTPGCNGSKSGPNDANNLNAQCQIPKCGDGYVNAKFAPGDAGVEACDNGSGDTAGCNGNSEFVDDAGHSNNMNAQCQIPRCGDGYVNRKFAPTDAGAEECEPGQHGNPDIGCPRLEQTCVACRCI